MATSAAGAAAAAAAADATDNQANAARAVALDKIAAEFRAEQPKLAAAVKNYMAYRTALTMSSGGVTASGTVGVKPVHVLAMARYVLNGLNDAGLLPTPLEFGVRHPQPETQAGFDRIDDLARYKVAYAVGAKLQEQGHKRTQFFGKSYFAATRIWEDLQKYVLARVEADAPKLWSGPPALAEFPAAFLEGLRGSLDETPDDSLVWSTDVSAVMRRRQAEREERAAKAAAVTERTAAEMSAAVRQLVTNAHTADDSDDDAVPLGGRGAAYDDAGVGGGGSAAKGTEAEGAGAAGHNAGS